jgi:hypothetical protein
MIEEPLTAQERLILIALCSQACPSDAVNPVILGLIAKLDGFDTVLVARRSVPSNIEQATRRNAEVQT